jgi:2-methylisocitrate lyase-like PEP mutase family enzyme
MKTRVYVIIYIIISQFLCLQTVFASTTKDVGTKKTMTMRYSSQKAKMEAFKQLHYQNHILMLPNAWDAISAKLFEKEGAHAIGTTSAGIAVTLGYPDGQRMPKDLFLKIVERIISSVNIPVSVDIEAGYGKTIGEICDTVQKLLDMGAVGVNLEDTDPKTNQIIEINKQVDRIRAIRQLADKNNLPLFINARTDIYWSSNVPVDKRYEETLSRLLAYKAAGADGVFVPGLTDISLITKLHNAIELPINVLGGTWITSMDSLKNTGVARISAGSGIFRSEVTHTQQAYRQFSHGNFSFLKNAISYDAINAMHK